MRDELAALAQPPPSRPPAPPRRRAPRRCGDRTAGGTAARGARRRPPRRRRHRRPRPTSCRPTGAAGPGWSAPLESLDAGRKRRRWVPWVIALVVVAALAGLGLLALQLFEVPKHPVPDLVGSDEATARAETADFDWDIEVRHERSDEYPHAGRDHPHRAGGRPGARRGGAVPHRRQRRPRVPCARGPRRADPGRGRDQARRAGARRPARARSSPTRTCPPGPSCRGRCPTTRRSPPVARCCRAPRCSSSSRSGPAPRTVPTLVGTTVEQATAALQAIQLGVTVAEPVFSDDIPAGSVVSANPPDGTGGIPRGTAVTITPSKGVDLVHRADPRRARRCSRPATRSPRPACSSARCSATPRPSSPRRPSPAS